MPSELENAILGEFTLNTSLNNLYTWCTVYVQYECIICNAHNCWLSSTWLKAAFSPILLNTLHQLKASLHHTRALNGHSAYFTKSATSLGICGLLHFRNKLPSLVLKMHQSEIPTRNSEQAEGGKKNEPRKFLTLTREMYSLYTA